MLVVRAKIHKMHARIAHKREYPDQTDSNLDLLHCLPRPFCRQLVFQVLKHLS